MAQHHIPRRDAALYTPQNRARSGSVLPRDLDGTIWLLSGIDGADVSVARGTAVLWFLDGAFTVNHGRCGISGAMRGEANPYLFDIQEQPVDGECDRAALVALIARVTSAAIDETDGHLRLSTENGATLYAETFQRRAK